MKKIFRKRLLIKVVVYPYLTGKQRKVTAGVKGHKSTTKGKTGVLRFWELPSLA